MKKLITLSFAALLIGCQNPSMEEGFESLIANLAEVEASLTPIVESITSDMADITATVAELQVSLDAQNGETAAMLETVAEINAALDRVSEELATKLTKEQVAALLEDVQALGEDIDMLVFIADYDYDGVMNGLDQCPDTPLSEINDVNGVGCSPSQTNG